ncbi:hypothetical protein JDV02_010853 [Purpureocillium takamizusanense]|uniref:Uncharacterized protein n=1 Tax=Purpureocillium takamizusanense TaxID=2060973 RepID=A0A9Q8QGI4_9HYPO|nr:uncharacterized protein JDV02_010853 [Purpureocillium takamizusanense]UNI18837.1 hypothetical protein JDV02_010853 [Purpureocillium takamizusanense]
MDLSMGFRRELSCGSSPCDASIIPFSLCGRKGVSVRCYVPVRHICSRAVVVFVRVPRAAADLTSFSALLRPPQIGASALARGGLHLPALPHNSPPPPLHKNETPGTRTAAITYFHQFAPEARYLL